jgi:hypothetical protein
MNAHNLYKFPRNTKSMTTVIDVIQYCIKILNNKFIAYEYMINGTERKRYGSFNYF